MIIQTLINWKPLSDRYNGKTNDREIRITIGAAHVRAQMLLWIGIIEGQTVMFQQTTLNYVCALQGRISDSSLGLFCMPINPCREMTIKPVL